MTDSEKLQKKIKEQGITFSFLAMKIGITREALYKKIRNESEFKASEIVTITKLLDLSDIERNEIFFNCMLN